MNGFTIYKEYYDLITLLNQREQEELSLAIFRYMFEDIEPSLNDKQMKIFKNLKRPLDVSKKNSIRSKGNGAPVGNTNALKTNQKQTKNKPKTNQSIIQKQTHQDVYVNNNVNVNSIKEDRVIGEEEKEILNFIDEQEIFITPQNYTSLKYFINKVDVEDIKQALILGKTKSFNYTLQTLRNIFNQNKVERESSQVSEELFDYDWINEGEDNE